MAEYEVVSNVEGVSRLLSYADAIKHYRELRESKPGVTAMIRPQGEQHGFSSYCREFELVYQLEGREEVSIGPLTSEELDRELHKVLEEAKNTKLLQYPTGRMWGWKQLGKDTSWLL